MTIYKILCEVKWLHEFYLTRDKGETIFEKAAQSDRLDFLFDRFVKDLPSIHEDLEFMEHPLNKTLSNYFIRILPSYAGFKLAVKCKKEKLGDGTVVYTPIIPLPDQLCLRVMIREKTDVHRFSSEISPKPFRGYWYFSNNNIPFAKTFPFLSSPISAFAAVHPYIQSEIALHAGIAKTFLNNGAPDPWLPLPGTRYINSNDSHLLQLSFNYTFQAFENITAASFTLKDSTSAVIKKIDFSASQPMQTVSVSFRTNEEVVKAVKHDAVIANQLYSLEVTGSGGYFKTFTGLLFGHDEIELGRYSGMIDLVIKPASANFHLLDAGGRLFTRILPGGIKQPAPLFELWMKSKSAFWQYANNRQRKFKLTPATTDLLADNAGVLVSKNPIHMSYTPVNLKKPDSSFQLLPNPDPELDVSRVGDKFILNMQVPDSNLFPLL
ncbi:MAG: hypothetical protein ACXWB9_02650 [Flavisolibacter sp.]